jgi:hypothetical protein
LAYNPLTRDGGAKLGRDFTLYGATSPRSKRYTGYEPARPVVPVYIYMGD